MSSEPALYIFKDSDRLLKSSLSRSDISGRLAIISYTIVKLVVV